MPVAITPSHAVRLPTQRKLQRDGPDARIGAYRSDVGAPIAGVESIRFHRGARNAALPVAIDTASACRTRFRLVDGDEQGTLVGAAEQRHEGVR